MVFKAFVLCASALLIQTILCQYCAGPMAARSALAYDGLAYDGLAGWPASRIGCGAIAPAIDIAAASSLNAAYGGGLPITSASATAPTGLAVTSENAYDGAVIVAGNLPFLGTAAMDGLYPTVGAGAVSYGCGDGIVAITAEGPIAGPAAIAPAIAPLGLGPAMAPLDLAATAPFGYATGSCGCSPYLY